MGERELKKYVIGMAGISVAVMLLFLLIFRMGLQRIEKEYSRLLCETATDVCIQVTGMEDVGEEVEKYIDGHGYSDIHFSRVSDEISARRDSLMLSALLLLSGSLILQTLWGIWGMQSIYHRVDSAVDLLAKIIGESRKTVIPAKWEEWKKLCEGQYNFGSIGRLYKQIWETAQIAQEREQDRMKEQLYLKEMMNDISHQIKTPLSSLQIFIDIFSKEIRESSERQDYITEEIRESSEKQGYIREGREGQDFITKEKRESLQEMANQASRQIERMRWLISGMLKLAQVEYRVLQWDNKIQPVCFTLEKSIDALRMVFVQKEQTVEICGDREAKLLHDTDWMQEALVNLLKNASEYAPSQGTIRISIEQTTLALVIAIEDHGPGIPADKLPKIFNRFYSVRDTKHSDGVGIGLALAKSIVEAQGGTITAFSQTGEASYTRFVLTFLSQTPYGKSTV